MTPESIGIATSFATMNSRMSPAYTASIWIEHRVWREIRPAAGAADHKRPLGVEIPLTVRHP
jgi:hypothetical protein